MEAWVIIKHAKWGFKNVESDCISDLNQNV